MCGGMARAGRERVVRAGGALGGGARVRDAVSQGRRGERQGISVARKWRSWGEAESRGSQVWRTDGKKKGRTMK